MSTGLSSDRETLIREKLLGFPDGTTEAVLEFVREHSEPALDRALHGILVFHTPVGPDGTKPELPAITAETRLREDLGLDSLAFAEMGFLVEDLIGQPMPEEDLLNLQTVGDFRALVLRAVRAA